MVGVSRVRMQSLNARPFSLSGPIFRLQLGPCKAEPHVLGHARREGEAQLVLSLGYLEGTGQEFGHREAGPRIRDQRGDHGRHLRLLQEA